MVYFDPPIGGIREEKYPLTGDTPVYRGYVIKLYMHLI
jgi:hypothetical protein